MEYELNMETKWKGIDVWIYLKDCGNLKNKMS